MTPSGLDIPDGQDSAGPFGVQQRGLAGLNTSRRKKVAKNEGVKVVKVAYR